ncbi:FAD binding domain containing protein [Elaphomyces granulatus]
MAPANVSYVDVLIIGAGPAGLALANWFRSSNICVRIIDTKPGPTPRGQAEGLKSTTLEIFEAFGIGPKIWAEAWRLEEVTIWGPEDINGAGGAIKRKQWIENRVSELGKPREVMLQQSRVEQHMLDNLLGSNNIEMQYHKRPTDLTIDNSNLDDLTAFPVHITVTSSKHEEDVDAASMNGSTLDEICEEVHAKYVVGCDGAHSWTRKKMGVMDIVPKSNFPDIRKVCYLQSSTGTILLVPRSNKEVRLYIPVESGSTLSDPKDLTFERILDAARKIIAPYSLDVGSCSWWSAYRVGQRVGKQFSVQNRVFLAGDAVHTHSPKAGQGMNTSIQDAFNLGWKLRQVLNGHASPRVLGTYESERRPVAEDLIAFDRGYLKLFSTASSSFESEFLRGMKFTTGLSIRYSPSIIVQLQGRDSSEDLTEHPGPSLLKADVVPGKRLPDFQVVCQADRVPTRIHPRLHASGAFRMLIFAGDISQTAFLESLQSLGSWLGDENDGLGLWTAGGNQARTEVLLIHSAKRELVNLLELPEVFHPWSETEGYDYWRVYADAEGAHDAHGRVYDRLELNKESGCVIIVRPDSYIGAVTGMGDFESIKKYFMKHKGGDSS